MKNGTAYLVGAGDFCPDGFKPGRGDVVIAADGGYRALTRLGVRPDWLLGDMDSIGRLPRGPARLRFPAKKDQTDIALAIRLARRLGYRRFRLYGALGGRLDHSLANLHLLSGLAIAGLEARAIGRKADLHAVSAGSLRLPPLKQGRVVSVFAWGGEALGVTLTGLAYPLFSARLDAQTPLGVSNLATGQPIHISVERGTLLVLVYKQAQA